MKRKANKLEKMAVGGAMFTKGVADRSGGMTYRLAKKMSGKK